MTVKYNQLIFQYLECKKNCNKDCYKELIKDLQTHMNVAMETLINLICY